MLNLLNKITRLQQKLLSEQTRLITGYFYGYIAGYVNGPLPETDLVFYFPHVPGQVIKTPDLFIPDASEYNNQGKTLPIFTIGGGTTLWGNGQRYITKPIVKTETDNQGKKLEFTVTDIANYSDCKQLVNNISNKGWGGICLDWEMIDKTHKYSDFIDLLQHIRDCGLLCILHSGPQGPNYVDQPKSNNIVDCIGLSKYIDYYLVLLFDKDPVLKNYTDMELTQLVDFWNNPNPKLGIKYKHWGNGTIGSKWDYIEKKKLLGLVSCFPDGYSKGQILPKNCKNKQITHLERVIKKNGWSGIITWAYQISS